ASERTSQKLDELLTQGVADGDARAELLKLAVRKIVEEALEAEVADAVGRGYYENGAPSGAGYRTGYRRGRLATAEGPIAWGITDDGQKVLLHLAPGTKEDTASCTAFFEDLKRRGLADPLLVVTDGAPGLIRAVETCFPRALRQRCLAHRLRNLRSKAPESRWPEIALRARGCYEAASPALATVLRDDFVQTYERELPAVVQCFS